MVRKQRHVSWYLLVILSCGAILAFCLIGDGNHSPSSDGLTTLTPPVKSAPGDNPLLENPHLNVMKGTVNNTIFNFSITLTDSTNSTPQDVNLTVIHENATYNWDMVNASGNFAAGVVFYREIMLPLPGNYSYHITASNGVNISRCPDVGSIAGPSVSSIENYTMTQVSYQWFDTSSGTPVPVNEFYNYHWNYSLPFTFNFYNHASREIQVSHFGFFKFSNTSNTQPITIPSAEPPTGLSGVLISGDTWDQCTDGITTMVIYLTTGYIVIEQDIVMFEEDRGYNITYQYVLFKNGSIQFNINQASSNFTHVETIGLNYGDNSTATTYAFSTNISHVSLLFTYPNDGSSRIIPHAVTPTTGNETTPFMFACDYRNLQGRAPLDIILELNGVEYAMFEADGNDDNYVNGKVYELSHANLSPSSTYSYSYRVLTPDGWKNSTTFSGPNLSWEGPSFSNYSTTKNLLFEWHQLDDPQVATAEFTEVSIPFEFPFYGINFSSFQLSRDGFIRFSGNTSTVKPTPGASNGASLLAINLLAEEFIYLNTMFYDSELTYQVYEDMFVAEYYFINYYNITSGGHDYLGWFQIILHSSGDILFSFRDLMELSIGGMNYGDGMHYEEIDLPALDDPPLSRQTFVFTPARPNLAVMDAFPIDGFHETTHPLQVGVNYSSSSKVHVQAVMFNYNLTDFHETFVGEYNLSIDFVDGAYENDSLDLNFLSNHHFSPGVYQGRYMIVDVLGNVFTTEEYSFFINDPPQHSVLSTLPINNWVGDLITIQVNYVDPEGLAPEHFTLEWDGACYNMTVDGTNFTEGVMYSFMINLTHGSHAYSLRFKDPFRPSNVSIIDGQIINVYYKPLHEPVQMLKPVIYKPGQYRVAFDISSPDGLIILGPKIIVDDTWEFDMERVSGTSVYETNVKLEPGTHDIWLRFDDGVREVKFVIQEVKVINLPLILIAIIIPSVVGIAGAYMIRKKREATRKRKQVIKKEIIRKRKQKILKKKLDKVKQEKRLERAKKLEQVEPITPKPIAKTSITVRKKPSAPSPAPPSKTATSSKSQAPAPPKTQKQREPSKYAPKHTDEGTLLNRAVLKQYIERMRRERNYELHYLKIKNDLNVISKSKSKKLYKLLNSLVDSHVLVRKKSKYVIVRR
ncbi:hypothetical protein GF325_05800 [Candidatus Bathyarchaeota archaeon]|nr:hypothetical protein [Candidatus Bathyarchaeota archaeon]